MGDLSFGFLQDMFQHLQNETPRERALREFRQDQREQEQREQEIMRQNVLAARNQIKQTIRDLEEEFKDKQKQIEKLQHEQAQLLNEIDVQKYHLDRIQ